MNDARKDSIKDIAEQLDCGYRAFIHKTSGLITYIPNEQDHEDIDLGSWSDKVELIEKSPNEYYEIEKWVSSEAFEMMSDFANQLSEQTQLQSRLFDALNKKKPFREFKFVIDSSGEFRQKWFDFKNKWQQDYVERQLRQQKIPTIVKNGST